MRRFFTHRIAPPPSIAVHRVKVVHRGWKFYEVPTHKSIAFYPWLPTFWDEIWHEGLTLYGAGPYLLEIWILPLRAKKGAKNLLFRT